MLLVLAPHKPKLKMIQNPLLGAIVDACLIPEARCALSRFDEMVIVGVCQEPVGRANESPLGLTLGQTAQQQYGNRSLVGTLVIQDLKQAIPGFVCPIHYRSGPPHEVLRRAHADAIAGEDNRSMSCSTVLSAPHVIRDRRKAAK